MKKPGKTGSKKGRAAILICLCGLCIAASALLCACGGEAKAPEKTPLQIAEELYPAASALEEAIFGKGLPAGEGEGSSPLDAGCAGYRRVADDSPFLTYDAFFAALVKVYTPEEAVALLRAGWVTALEVKPRMNADSDGRVLTDPAFEGKTLLDAPDFENAVIVEETPYLTVIGLPFVKEDGETVVKKVKLALCEDGVRRFDSTVRPAG